MAKLLANATVLLKDVTFKHVVPSLKLWQQYARVELTPPSPRDFAAIRSGFAKLIEGARIGRYREVTVREGVINSLVAIEIYCWFYIGECIGKRKLIGYEA